MAHEANESRLCLSRRAFLLASGTAAGVVLVTGIPGLVNAALQTATYPRQKVGQLSSLKLDAPQFIQYPWKDPYSMAMLVKLGVTAGGGVGPQRDVVAFSTLCTHMGGPLQGTYKERHKVLGPCPFHLTTFDLTRHGMVVAGQATESLPQIWLEVQGDDIYAAGVMGLIYGYHANLAAKA
ncbi:MAG: arsenate reductase (azurin) small subunit [Chloroflexota bacterium]